MTSYFEYVHPVSVLYTIKTKYKENIIFNLNAFSRSIGVILPLCRSFISRSSHRRHCAADSSSGHHQSLLTTFFVPCLRTIAPSFWLQYGPSLHFIFSFFPSRCFRLIINRILDEGILLVCQSNCNLQSIINIRYFRILKNSMLVRVYIESDKYIESLHRTVYYIILIILSHQYFDPFSKFSDNSFTVYSFEIFPVAFGFHKIWAIT